MSGWKKIDKCGRNKHATKFSLTTIFSFLKSDCITKRAKIEELNIRKLIYNSKKRNIIKKKNKITIKKRNI